MYSHFTEFEQIGRLAGRGGEEERKRLEGVETVKRICAMKLVLFGLTYFIRDKIAIDNTRLHSHSECRTSQAFNRQLSYVQ